MSSRTHPIRRAGQSRAHDPLTLHARPPSASERYDAMVENCDEGIWTIDVDHRTTFVNQRMAHMLGYEKEEMLGRPLFDFVDSRDRHSELDTTLRRTGYPRPAERRLLRKNGDVLWTRLSSSPITRAGRYAGSLAMVTDLTDRRRAARELEDMALRDTLTGLPNRALLEARLHHALAVAGPGSGGVAVFLLGIDRFNSVNDAFGRESGDEVLREVASRLERELVPVSTLARFGGDEFVILCEDVHGDRDALAIGRRLAEALNVTLQIEQGEFTMTISVGIALRSGKRTAEQMLRDADIAMHHVKERGGSGFEVCDATMRSLVTEQVRIESELGGALERGEFRLLYQPIIDLSSDEVAGFETLVRWYHPERGVVQPAEFIPVAERTGMIVSLGSWILREACRQVAVWTAGAPGRPWAGVSVNVSTRQLHASFPEMVRDALDDSGIDASNLALELTETALMDQNGEVARDTLPALKRMGVRIVIDDFGTGYSSLGYVHSLPLDGLKIDQRFVAGIDADISTLPIVRAIASMAHSLGLDVVAEGVEEPEQLRSLQELGCEFAQGFLYSRALPPAAVPDWIESRERRPQLPGRQSASDEAERSASMGEAATALQISPSTLRRWLDQGRLPFRKTAGGHRRIDIGSLQAFKRMSKPRAKLQKTPVPTGPLPQLAQLLDEHGKSLALAACRALYDPNGPGWFQDERARSPLQHWLSDLAGACRTGSYDGVGDSSRRLQRHAMVGGASTLECQLFAERLAAVVSRALEQKDGGRAELVSAQRLLTVARHAVLSVS